ncbi:MAG: peptide ABC transporter substrate-binding protein [Chlamydiales bacterium]
MSLSEKELILGNSLTKILYKFPTLFDDRLLNGLYKLKGNSTNQFISSRSHSHMQRILIVQFFLQKKMEALLEQGAYKKSLFLKIFPEPSHLICTAVAIPFRQEQDSFGGSNIFKAFCSILPGVRKISHSYYSWMHPELPYLFCYLEVQKLRGRDLSLREIRNLEKPLKELLTHSIIPLTPGVFYPYNEEESYRQLLLLQKEMNQLDDLPNVSIYFREQTPSYLEFLVHLVRVESEERLESAAQRLPASVYYFPHLHRKASSYQWEIFSLRIPSPRFYENGAINLLYARRLIVKYVQQLVGPFRDYNGGLFEKQQEHFESLKMNLAETIPNFYLFAEKLFYSLKPIEARLSLSFEEARKLFKTASKSISGSYNVLSEKDILVVKTAKLVTLLPLINKIKEWEEEEIAYAQFSCSDFHYLCVLDRKNIYLSQLESLLKSPLQSRRKHSTLRLTFQEGEPLSLNPHYAFGDMRCRVLSKLLFEGITRIDAHGAPQLAAAEKMQRSQDGLTYLFKLRLHHWSNGEKVTAFHFVNSWHSILKNLHFSSSAEFLFMIKNVQKYKEGGCSFEEVGFRAHDTETLEIQLEWPDPIFLYKLAQPMFFPMLNRAKEPQWFNGPYLIEKQTTQDILLESNPYYWDYPRIFFKSIQIECLSDVKQSYALFQKGEIDWMGSPLCGLTFEMIVQLQAKGELQKKPATRALWIYINTSCPCFVSSKIRKALSLSLDRSLIVKHIYPGDSPLYQPLPSSLSLCQNMFSDNNVRRAKKLFEEGLKEIKSTKEMFPPLTLSYPNTSGRESVAEYLKEVWEETFGIHIQLKGPEWNVFLGHLEKGEFQLGMCFASALYPDPSELLERFGSIKIANFSQWVHPIYQKKLNLAKKLPDQRTQFLREAEQLLFEEVPFIPICSFNALYVHNPRLRGYVFDHNGCIDFRWAYLED